MVKIGKLNYVKKYQLEVVCEEVVEMSLMKDFVSAMTSTSPSLHSYRTKINFSFRSTFAQRIKNSLKTFSTARGGFKQFLSLLRAIFRVH